MRIVLDLQACQSDSRFRGIGRYSMSLGKALARELLARNHEVIIALSSTFPADVTDEVKTTFSESVPGVRFFEFNVPKDFAASKIENHWRQMSARLLREHAIACLEPDIVHLSSLLADGWGDDFVASVGLLGLHIPTALTQYDLIPLIMSDVYLTDEHFRDYYLTKLEYVRQADLLLAISEYSKKEALQHLHIPDCSVVNMSSAVNDDFFESSKKSNGVEATLHKYGIKNDFLLYAPGGFDPRKNLNRLLEAYALLPADIRNEYHLVIASKLPTGYREGLLWKAGTLGIDKSELVLTDYVSDADLADLYRGCRAYIFPSLSEGFGLPVLEAMSCGAVVIASNTSSIPEAHGLPEALFDPYQSTDIKDKIQLALIDEEFRTRLKDHAAIQIKKFSWDASAVIAADAMENLLIKTRASGIDRIKKVSLPSYEDLLLKMDSLRIDSMPSGAELDFFKSCFTRNLGDS